MPFIIGVIFLAWFAVLRYNWLDYKRREYYFLCNYYVITRVPDATFIKELNELFPASYMFMDILHWDFTRYIVNFDNYNEVLDAAIADSKLTPEKLNDKNKELDKEK